MILHSAAFWHRHETIHGSFQRVLPERDAISQIGVSAGRRLRPGVDVVEVPGMRDVPEAKDWHGGALPTEETSTVTGIATTRRTFLPCCTARKWMIVVPRPAPPSTGPTCPALECNASGQRSCLALVVHAPARVVGDGCCIVGQMQLSSDRTSCAHAMRAPDPESRQ